MQIHSRGAESMHICVCVCVGGGGVCVCVWVCVLERLVAPEEAVCHKASLAFTGGPTARAGGMKLKLTTKEKRERKK